MRSLHISIALAAALVASVLLGAEEKAPLNSDLFLKSLEAAHQAIDFYGAFEDRDELRRVADIGYQIARETRFDKFPFSFFLIDIPVPNAFALPGGQIFITRGMLDLGLDDDMLAGLLGHEIGHVVLDHGVRMQRRATLLNVLSQTILAGVILASENDRDTYVPPPGRFDPSPPSGDRIMGTAAAGLVLSELLLRSYSREFEDEADDEGQRYAAGAGFDPTGYRQLMQLMRARLPESKEYGYWRTHPFFDSRVKAADVRAELLSVQARQSADELRQQTQARLLTAAELPEIEADQRGILEYAALAAWPIGPAADRIRLARLHEKRDVELDKNELARNYGALLDLYGDTRADVALLDPDGSLLSQLDSEIAGFREAIETSADAVTRVLEGGVYSTDFLETYISNYPDSQRFPAVALELADAYARLRRIEDAASMYLQAWRAAPESESGHQARKGLRTLTPKIDSLSMLNHLSMEAGDEVLRELASDQLASQVDVFADLANGAQFLKEHPDSEHAEAVTARINALAADLLGEATLYQRVGDHAKALDRINQILTDAPFSPAAATLRQNAVLEG